MQHYNEVIFGLSDRHGKAIHDEGTLRQVVDTLTSDCISERWGVGVYEGREESSLWVEGEYPQNAIISLLKATNQVCALVREAGKPWVFLYDNGHTEYAGVLASQEGKPEGDHSEFDGRYYVLVR